MGHMLLQHLRHSCGSCPAYGHIPIVEVAGAVVAHPLQQALLPKVEAAEGGQSKPREGRPGELPCGGQTRVVLGKEPKTAADLDAQKTVLHENLKRPGTAMKGTGLVVPLQDRHMCGQESSHKTAAYPAASM